MSQRLSIYPLSEGRAAAAALSKYHQRKSAYTCTHAPTTANLLPRIPPPATGRENSMAHIFSTPAMPSISGVAGAMKPAAAPLGSICCHMRKTPALAFHGQVADGDAVFLIRELHLLKQAFHATPHRAASLLGACARRCRICGVTMNTRACLPGLSAGAGHYLSLLLK